MLDFIPRPKTKQGIGVAIIIAAFASILSAWLLISSFDIIPDSLGPFGYLDDAIMIIVIAVFSFRLYDRITGRYQRNKMAYKTYFQSHSILSIFTSMKFWVVIGITGATIAYVIWSLDLIPDRVPILGYLDDGVAIIYTLKTLIEFVATGGRK